MRQILVVARDEAVRRDVADALHATGLDLVVTSTCAPEQVEATVARMRPAAVAAERGTLNVSQISAPLVEFDPDPARFDPLETARALLAPPVAPEPPQPIPFVAPTYKLAASFIGVAGGVGVTTTVCALALAAARRRERALIVDCAGGDTAVTFGCAIQPKISVNEFLSVIVTNAPHLAGLETAPFDVFLFDVGKLGWNPGAETFAGQFGAVNWLVAADDMHQSTDARMIVVGTRPGSALSRGSILRVPYDAEVTARVNHAQFDPSDSPLSIAADAIMQRWLTGEAL